jgi:Protein of unknown function (DUF4087)
MAGKPTVIFMKIFSLVCLTAALFGAFEAYAGETRCGWIDNPTPGNFWLIDGEGEWEISAQGGYEAEGMDALPDFSGDEFVETNGHHGYSCGCITGETDEGEKKIVKIESAEKKLLKLCLEDDALPSMKDR